MALPNDGQMTNTTITVSEYRTFLDNTVSDIAKGNTEFVGARTYVNGAEVLASNGFKYISQRNGNQGNDPLIDDGSNWRINDPVLNVVASLYTGGDESKICRLVNGVSVNGFTYGIYSGFDGYSVWSIGGVTGTMTSDFDPVTKTATGLSGSLLEVRSFNQIAGEVKLVASTTAPEGTLKCNGATVSRTTYARLFASIGTIFGAGDGSTTFQLPDLRGEFIRGLDDGRGVDSGRGIGSFQVQGIQSHNHTMNGAGSHSHTLPMGDFDGATEYPDRSGNGVVGTATTSAVGDHTHFINANGGVETRPRNIALLYVITI